MRRGLATVAIVVTSALGVAARADAQRLHVYGPEGNATERRVLMVFETREGDCAPWDTVTLAAIDAGLSIEVAAGQGCARWVHLRSDAPRDEVAVRATHQSVSVDARVELRIAPVRVRAVREGSELRVRVADSGDGHPSGTVYWRGGSAALTEDEGALRATVPADALLGIVVRAGARVGATAVAPLVRAGHAETLLMPSTLVLPAAGTSRTAAYVVVADGHGRLSRSVPLEIVSEQASLSRLQWVDAGVAAIWLSADASTASVDLDVSAAAQEHTRISIAAAAGWPVSAAVRAPDTAAPGEEILVRVSAEGADGAPVPPSSLGVRCGGARVALREDGSAPCVLAQSDASVVAFAAIDGADVPISSARVRALAPALAVLAPASQPPQARSEPEPETAPDVVAALRVAATLMGALDVWGRPGGGAGLALRLRPDPHLGIDVALRYQVDLVSAAGRGLVQERMEGAQHAFEATAGVRALPFGPEIPLELFGALGVASVSTEARVGDALVSSADVLGIAWLGLGTTLLIDDFSLGVDLGARLAFTAEQLAWDLPVARFGLEVSGGFDVAP